MEFALGAEYLRLNNSDEVECVRLVLDNLRSFRELPSYVTPDRMNSYESELARLYELIFGGEVPRTI